MEQPELKKRPSRKKELVCLLCLLLALAVFCQAAVQVVTPKRHDYGAVWGMYAKEPKNSVDVLFFGSSLAYCDIVPAVLYEETGVTSFVMAGPKQTPSVTCAYLRQALKTQSPKTVFVEMTRFVCDSSNESVKVNLTYLPWGRERLAAAFRDVSGDERMGLLFPLYAYHDRWDKLKAEDWKAYTADPLAGYTFLDRATPDPKPVEREHTEDPEDYEANLACAREIARICEEKGIRLVFFLSPAVSEGHTEKLFADLKEQCPGADLVDFNDIVDDLGLDYGTDFYDKNHFNYRGAEKFSVYLAERLPEWGVAHTVQEDKVLWQQRIDHFRSTAAQWEGKPIRLNEGLEKGGSDT